MENGGVLNAMNQIILSKELKEFIIPLSDEEFNQLKQNIKDEGCRDPLTVWRKSNGDQILIDGHNRYEICNELNIDFEIKHLKFSGIDEAKLWMITNQLGRRNLNGDQLSYYRGIKYESLKNSKGGYKNVISKGQNELSTSSKLAQEYNTSESTIKRDSKFARGLDFIGRLNNQLKNDILLGKIKVKKADIILFSDIDKNEIKSLKNEADLHNKANNLRNNVLAAIEKNLKSDQEIKVKEARAILEERENPFSSYETRINRIKGQILSAMNRAIQNKDMKAIDELKSSIEKLQGLLFSE